MGNIVAPTNRNKWDSRLPSRIAAKDALLVATVESAKHLFKDDSQERGPDGRFPKAGREVTPGEPERRCRNCGDWAPVAHEFFRFANGAFKWRCRECDSEKSRESRSDPESQAKATARSHRRRARKLGATGTFSGADVRAQWERQKGLCFYCSEELNTKSLERGEGLSSTGRFHADHYIPLAKGGTNAADNIVLSCPTCNFSKGAKSPEKFIKLNKP